MTVGVDAPVVLVTSRSFSTGRAALREELEAVGARVTTGTPDHAIDALAPLLDEATAWIAGTGPVTELHFAAAPRLRLVARYGTGVDNVDLDAAIAHRVLVTNTPGANTEAVADHAVALVLGALRGVVNGDRSARDGSATIGRTRELGTLRVGLIGIGRIGRSVARRIAGFGGEIWAYDPHVPDELIQSWGVRAVPLERLAAGCDLISLHLPGERIVVDHDLLRTVRPGTILVNTARAGAVDEDAIAGALRAGRLSCYATDVLAAETGGDSPLLADDLVPSTIITPHVAAHTVEAVDRMGRGAVDAVLAVLRGEAPEHLVTGGAQ